MCYAASGNMEHPMVGGALMGIVFVCTLVCFALWSLFYIIHASHYFLTTLADSSSGQDEVQFPREGFIDWWWKPILCVWILLVWLIPSSFFLLPLIFVSAEAYLIVWVLFLWLVYPLSLSSSLYAQSWLVFVHWGVVGRMLRHVGALIYVHVITLGLFALCGWMIKNMVTDSFVWMIPAIALVPLSLLLYARHWGRFAWLSLNYLPRSGSKGRPEMPAGDRTVEDPWAYEEPEPPKPVVDPTAFKAAAPNATSIRATEPVEEPDEWSEDHSPYLIIHDPTVPSFEETPTIPLASAAPPEPQVAPAYVEEEDEWATDKKPYNTTEPVPSVAHKTKAEEDRPITATEYFDERDRKEKIAARKAEKAKRKMAPRSKKTPAFTAAMLVGVWSFLRYPSTLIVLAAFTALTVMEFVLLYMMIVTFPKAL